jgi:RNA polymerase-binding protein DksA
MLQPRNGTAVLQTEKRHRTMTTLNLTSVRTQLIEERERLQSEIAAEAALEGVLGEASGEEAIEEGDLFEQELAVSVESSLRNILGEVERALQKLDAGDYGVCDQCGKPIAPERLEVRPESGWCVDCKTKREHWQAHSIRR